MGLRPAKSHEKLSGRRLADEILWGRLVTCGRLAIGPCRLRGGPAAVTNRRAGCQPAPHWFFAPVPRFSAFLVSLVHVLGHHASHASGRPLTENATAIFWGTDERCRRRQWLGREKREDNWELRTDEPTLVSEVCPH